MSESHHEKNPERVVAGLKASIHNPTVSEEAKNHARERLREMGVDAEEATAGMTTRLGTHAVHPEKEKMSMEDTLPHSRLRSEHHVHVQDDTEEHRMLGGYKATLKNPNTSQEAKEHARKVLEEHGALNE